MSDTNDQEFEAAWKLASGDTTEARAPVPAIAGEDGDAAADAAAAKPEDGEAADPNRQDGAADDQPPANTDTPTPDIWADAPEHLKAAYDAAIQERDRLEHQRKSDEGRVASFQRRSDELRRQLTALRTTSEQEDLKTYLDSDEYKKSKSEYEGDLGPIFQLIEGLAKNTSASAEQIGQVTSTAAEQIAAEVETLLDELAPDREKIINDERFIPWLEKEPAFVRQLAARNWDHVSDPAEFVELCDRARKAFGIEMPKPAGSEADETTQPTETSRRRELQLEGSKSTTTRQQMTQPGAAEDDFDGAWQEAAAAIKKRA